MPIKTCMIERRNELLMKTGMSERKKRQRCLQPIQVWVYLSILFAYYECIGTLIEFWALTTIPDDLQLYNPLADQPP